MAVSLIVILRTCTIFVFGLPAVVPVLSPVLAMLPVLARRSLLFRLGTSATRLWLTSLYWRQHCFRSFRSLLSFGLAASGGAGGSRVHRAGSVCIVYCLLLDPHYRGNAAHGLPLRL